MSSCKQCVRFDRTARSCTLYDECIEEPDKCAGFSIRTNCVPDKTLDEVLEGIKQKHRVKHKQKPKRS